MLKLIISLSGSWVLSHRGDDVLPVDLLAKKIVAHFGNSVVIEDTGLTEIVLSVNGESGNKDEIISIIKTIFSDSYSADEANRVLSIQTEEAGGQLESSEEMKKKAEQRASGSSSESSGDSGSLGGLDSFSFGKLGGFGDLGGCGGDSPSGSSDRSTEGCLKEIDALVGAEEFKALAREIVEIAPQIIKNGTFDVLSQQAYIFSINDGCGLTTYLHALAKLLASLNIRNVSNIDDVIEQVVHFSADEREDPFGPVLNNMRFGGSSSMKIICIDICDWMSKTNSSKFKEFFAELTKRMSSYIIIFRVPFVEKDVLSQLKNAINDRMFVRTVSFPPFNHDELQACAAAELKRYDFSISDEAWEGFHARIAEEKRDGRFYGINTIKKVVRELLYKKQLSNARLGKDDNHISAEDISEICTTPQDANISGYEMLDHMIGGEAFKNRINEIVAQIEFARSTPGAEMPCIHMRFLGNPGTGKTTVARIVGKIFREKGILRIGNFFEYSGRDFCGRYIGETAPKTATMCRDAYGSVLFIDEAYSLYRGDDNERDYGREALDTLIAEMENHRSDLVVIMAGYTDEMNTLMEGNAGLASRMPYIIEFPNFTREELYDIFVSMIGDKYKYEESMLPAAKEYFMNIPDQVINSKEFSNARFVRNLFERTVAKASMRCQLNKIEEFTLTQNDFERSIIDREFTFTHLNDKKPHIGFVN